MRIIAGQARGLTLKAPAGNATRPMDGRTRGALFNILFSRQEGARILDLYAGSGSLGLEALSRGAESCVFVERSRAVGRVIAENLSRTGLEGGEILTMPSSLAIKTLQARGERFSVAFFDPPFPLSRGAETRAGLLRELAEVASLLEPRGLVIWRLEKQNYHPGELPSCLHQTDRREYGRSLLVFLSPCGEESAETSAEPEDADDGDSR